MKPIICFYYCIFMLRKHPCGTYLAPLIMNNEKSISYPSISGASLFSMIKKGMMSRVPDSDPSSWKIKIGLRPRIGTLVIGFGIF